MSNPNWMPDSTGASSETEAKAPYVVVPRLALAGGLGLNRLNIAGWGAKEDGTYICKTCNKQVRLSLIELRLFPLVKPDTDLFQFLYLVPLHKRGGALSVEMCQASETKEVRSHESPTTLRFLEKDKILTVAAEGVLQESGQNPSPSTEERIEAEKGMRAKVAAFSPQKTEERYNYLLGKRITELTDEEYSERLALVERLTKKERKEKK